MADSPSTGGFWQWDMMLHPYIEAYDPVTRTAYVPCYQSGCRHNDSTCSACFGNLSALAEYRDSLYALVQQDGESAASLVSRPLSGGALRVLASWEPENEGEKYRCAAALHFLWEGLSHRDQSGLSAGRRPADAGRAGKPPCLR